MRAASESIGVRRANNAVKRALLDRYGPGPGGWVLDMACGRFGDLDKYRAALGPGGYVLGIDISEASIREGRRRIGAPAPAQFTLVRADMTDPGLWRWLPRIRGVQTGRRFDMAVCHFALHYAWDAEPRAAAALANAAARLGAGGTFVCTIVDSAVLGASRRNELYAIDVPEQQPQQQQQPQEDRGSAFVARPYTFSLTDAVEGCVEYAVPPDALRRLAGDAGLRVREGPLAFEGIVGPDAWRALSPAEREVCALYVAWIFEKV